MTLIFMLSFFICFSGCEKNKDKIKFESTGIILGADLAECICCGGYIIEIDGDDGHYRFETLPENSTIDLETATFPLSVKLNWHTDRTCAELTYIVIEDIEKN